MRLAIAVLLSLAAVAANADGNRQWSPKIPVGNPVQDGVFHNLDGSGRKHIAVAGDNIAIVWEDESSGSPQVYLVTKTFDQQTFSSPIKVSNGSEAYEPTIAALNNGSFVIVYEQDGAVYANFFREDNLSKPRLLSSTANSPGIATNGEQAFVVWREKHKDGYRLLVTSLSLNDKQLVAASPVAVEAEALQTPVLKPDIAIAGTGIFVAWEDRREGHTRLLYSHSDSSELQFAAAENLNEFFSGRNEYDKGSGVTRLSMAAFAEDEILAAWMDKRRGGKGYGIFAALGSADDESFGPNEKVHGKKGDEQPHYNPSVAGNREGDFIVAWHDFRNGDLDIWLSSYNDDDEWGDDQSPEVASGPGEQSHASTALDENGGLHLVWISRQDTSSPTGLWYSYGIEK